MFGVDFLNPYVLMICNAGFSPDLTSLSLAPARGYGLRIVTTRANSKRFKRLRRRGTLVASPCPARSTRCHPKHGLVLAYPSGSGRGLVQDRPNSGNTFVSERLRLWQP